VPDDPKKPDQPSKPAQPPKPDQPAVTVTNVGILLGTIVQQIDITQVLKVLDAATNLTNIEQYNQLKPELVKAVADLKTYLTRQDAQISNLQNQLTAAQTQVTTLTNANTDLNNQLSAANAQIAQLKAQLAAGPQTALPLHVAQSFKNVVDQIQSDARAGGGVQTTITNMQIAVKALVNVQKGTGTAPGEAVLVFPDPATPPDPNLLSTLTVNFSAIPNVKAGTTPAAGPVRAVAPPTAVPPQPPPPPRSGGGEPAPPPKPEAPKAGAKDRKSVRKRIKDMLRKPPEGGSRQTRGADRRRRGM
jgi:hypothetical protein